MNIRFGRGSFVPFLQLIFWNPFDAEAREHIGVGYGRWPSGDTLAKVLAHGWSNYGFHGVVFGPFEVRYWPRQICYAGIRRGPVVRTDGC